MNQRQIEKLQIGQEIEYLNWDTNLWEKATFDQFVIDDEIKIDVILADGSLKWGYAEQVRI